MKNPYDLLRDFIMLTITKKLIKYLDSFNVYIIYLGRIHIELNSMWCWSTQHLNLTLLSSYVYNL